MENSPAVLVLVRLVAEHGIFQHSYCSQVFLSIRVVIRVVIRVGMWIDAKYGFIAELVRSVVRVVLGEHKEGMGVWNSSRAPHCYGYEYEQEFGVPFVLGKVPAEHEAVWRASKLWPNVPPVSAFYKDRGEFEEQQNGVFAAYNAERRRKEALARAEHKRLYELSYNEVRRERRRKRKAEKLEGRKAYWEDRKRRERRFRQYSTT